MRRWRVFVLTWLSYASYYFARKNFPVAKASIQRQLGVTSVVVTHDIKSADTVADRMVLLYQGTVVFQGTPEETHATRDPMVRQFLAGSGQGPIQPV